MVLPHGLCQLLLQINFTRMLVANKIGIVFPSRAEGKFASGPLLNSEIS